MNDDKSLTMDSCIICKTPEVTDDALHIPKAGFQTILEYFQLMERPLLNENRESIRIHKSCQKKIGNEIRKIKRSNETEGMPTCKMIRRSAESFDSNVQCLFCGNGAIDDEKKKHPDRHTFSYPDISMKKRLLEICGRPHRINSELSHIVRGRLMTTDDVIADKVRYHRSCLRGFTRDEQIPCDEAPSKQVGRPLSEKKNENFGKFCEWLELEAGLHSLSELQTKLIEIAGNSEDVYAARYLKQNLINKYGNTIFFTEIDDLMDVVCFGNVAGSLINEMWKKNKSIPNVNETESSRVEDEERCVIPAECLFKVVDPIRKQMDKIKNTFDGSFSEKCQQKSCPALLQTLCSLLINGVGPETKGISQPALTVSQIIMHEFKKTHTEVAPVNTRHVLKRETPLPRYVGLMLYTMRAKTTIQKLYLLGISISYERCLNICDGIALAILKKYDDDKVFVSNTMRKRVFTVIAKDNIDVNAKSTKVSSHYHGISFSIMQFLTKENVGVLQEKLYDLSEKSTKKLILPEEYTEFKPIPFLTKAPLFYPTCTVNVVEEEPENGFFKVALKEETDWLESVSTSNIDTCVSWSENYSAKVPSTDLIPGIHSMMPPINKKVASIEAQYHCMTIIKDTIGFINGDQVPVDVSDQPVFAKSKEIQLRHPTEFGAGKYVCLLGDLHIEQSIQVLHAALIKGSGLDGVLSRADLSTSGTSTIVDVNDLKRTRYCIQVAACSIFMLLKDAHSRSGSELSIFQWLDDKSKSSQMCYYWRMILLFQLQILIFVRSIRAGNFSLYVQTLHTFLKWYFALDKYNYSRWATIYWFDLISLKFTCPDVYSELMKGHFSFLKSNKPFSRMGLDQLHEQNNKVIKGICGATNLLNRDDESALNRWALSAPELAQMISEFEDMFQAHPDSTRKHHESSPSFQRDFYNDVQKVKQNFIVNPFELNELTVVNNTDVMFDDNIYQNIKNLEVVGTTQLETFIKDRLIMSKVSLNGTISLNHFALPGDDKNKKPRGTLVDKRLCSSFLTKLRGAIVYRRRHAQLLFSGEIFGTAQSLAINETTPYQGTKSTLLNRFGTCEIPTIGSSSAIVIELSPLLRNSLNVSTFGNFGEKLLGVVLRLAFGYDRIDIICDRYFEDSLKNQTRDGRGSGEMIEFDRNTKFPSDFKENFLKNSKNKDRLNVFLAEEFIQHYSGDKTLVITKNDSVLSNDETLCINMMLTPNTAEEADQKLVRHALQCVRSGFNDVVIRTVDTDVLLLLIAYRHWETNTDSKVFGWMAASKDVDYYDINHISSILGEERCKAIPFFHAMTGCDTTSYFFNHGKCKFWDRWEEFSLKEELTSIFGQLSHKPSIVTNDQALLLEKYVSFVYHNIESEDSIDLLRMRDFEYSTHNNLRLIPPSRAGLLEHFKRAAYEGGWISFQCVENVDLPCVLQYGRKRLENGQIVPIWCKIESESDPLLLTGTCSCTKARCTACNCAKKNPPLPCLPFCGCRGTCQFNSI